MALAPAITDLDQLKGHPAIGKLLAWNNLLADGTPNPATLHQGMKVRRGTKYVLTKWFRERPL